MSREEYNNLWKCKYCHESFVVPSLARDHELKCYCNTDSVESELKTATLEPIAA